MHNSSRRDKGQLKAKKLITVFIQHAVNKITLSFIFIECLLLYVYLSRTLQCCCVATACYLLTYVLFRCRVSRCSGKFLIFSRSLSLIASTTWTRYASRSRRCSGCRRSSTEFTRWCAATATTSTSNASEHSRRGTRTTRRGLCRNSPLKRPSFRPPVRLLHTSAYRICIVHHKIFVGLFHSILCLLILYVLFSRLGYNEKYTHTHTTIAFCFIRCLDIFRRDHSFYDAIFSLQISIMNYL